MASKATGFSIAKIAAQLAVGLTLDEITNDITRKTPASFEPTLDYTVVPGSGTGDLIGLTGTVALDVDDDGTHRVTLTYTLP